MTFKLWISLVAAVAVLAGGTGTLLHADEPSTEGPVVLEESAVEVFPVEIDHGDLPTIQELLSAELGLGAPEPLEQRCVCVSYQASCENICGLGNYTFECYPTSHVFCECTEGSGGFYQTCS